jgi:hypothetical protein
MRQRLLVFVDPSPITYIDITAAERAISGSAWPRSMGAPGDLPSNDDAARKWIFHTRDFHL